MSNYYVNGLEVTAAELEKIENDLSITIIRDSSTHFRTLSQRDMEVHGETLVDLGLLPKKETNQEREIPVFLKEAFNTLMVKKEQLSPFISEQIQRNPLYTKTLQEMIKEEVDKIQKIKDEASIIPVSDLGASSLAKWEERDNVILKGQIAEEPRAKKIKIKDVIDTKDTI